MGNEATGSGGWRAWRREERKRLLEARAALPPATRQELAHRVLSNLDAVLGTQPVRLLGLYWPIKREINLLDWAAARSADGLALALPVVTRPHAPLEYWLWRPGDRMTRGFWNIPVPAAPAPVDPDVVVAPLVGFHGCWRLGYGGGYFDRTLAARVPRPMAIGIGLDLMEIPAFHPEPHDIPMQVIVTESRPVSQTEL